MEDQEEIASRENVYYNNVKGKGPRQERETTITFNEVENTGSIWTSSEPMYRKLKKLGFYPVEDRDRSATFEIPKKCISVRKPKLLSEKQRAVSLKSLQAARSLHGKTFTMEGSNR